MLTLRMLQEMVVRAEDGKRVPSAAKLEKLGVPVVVKENLGGDTDIAVFENGFVLYREGGHRTVFPLHSCSDYTFESCMGKGEVCRKDFFDNENWYFRLVLEGADRLEHNGDVKESRWNMSYSDWTDSWAELGSLDTELEKLVEGVESEETCIRNMAPSLTERELHVLQQICFEEKSQAEVVEELHISQQAVSRLFCRGKKKIKAALALKKRGEE